jgi:dimethylargininase
MLRALVRLPGDSFAQAISAQEPRPSIDPGLARQQHATYCAALREASVALVELPSDERYPDGCFVQDTAMVFEGLAVVARFGVKSRQGEQEAVRQALQGHKRLAEIRAPAILEGGDVLVIGNKLFVGLSTRTDRGGFAQLRDLVELEGGSVEPVQVPEGLHLLSGCTYLGQGVVLATGLYAELPAFAGLDVIYVPPEEGYAANALGLGEYVLLPEGYPQTAARIRARGFEILSVPLSEFAKADGGATCLSLLF